MKKKIFSIVLAMCMVLSFVPQASFAAGETGSEPSVSAYATKEQLTGTTFAPDSSGNATNIGKLVFGKNSSGSPQEWYILGRDSGVTGDNTIIFAASPIVTGQAFEGNATLIHADGSTNEKPAGGDYTYKIDNVTAVPGDVYLNHYGASPLHSKLQAIITDSSYFTQAEQGMMNATTVTTRDTRNNLDYTTTGKLYALAADGTGAAAIKAGSGNQIVLAKSKYWNEGTSFWLRSPCTGSVDSVFHDSCFALYANMNPDVPGDVYYFLVTGTYGVRPAGNLNLSSVLFASSATAASSDAVSGTITSGTAMTLRLDGSSKNIGAASYNATTGDIKAVKGGTSGDVSLVVQGNDGTNDWYYSKKITGTEIVKSSDIAAASATPASVDLAKCKIWLETTDTNGMIYAVGASATTTKFINSAAVTGIDAPAANTALDTKAACTTEGVSSTAPSITWTPGDTAAGYNTSYKASVTLTAADGYEFTDSATVTVNGVAASVTKNQNGTLTVTYTFPATAKDKLTSITAPDPITVANGTAYDEMNLPATVAIVTEGGTAASASVSWNTTAPASGSYDPDVLTEQKVTLNGTVTCPENIDSNGKDLTTTITITISAADTVKAPQANPAGGTYTSNQSVVLSSETEGAEIYYTTDGSEPSKSSTKYTAPIPVTGAEAQSVETTIKAIAVKERMQDSSVGTFIYTIEIPDTTAPAGEIKIAENSWKTFLNDITFGLFFKDTQTVTITANDNSGEAVTIEYLLSSDKLGAEDLNVAAFTTYDNAFSISPDKKYVIYAKLTDASGNAVYINSNGIVLDATAPVISGIENGKTYCSAQNVTIEEEHLAAVTVNGSSVSVTDNQFTLNPAEGKQTIVVADKAGNVSAEMIVTVNDGHRGGIATCTRKAICDYCKTEYGELDSSNHDIEKIPAKDATVIKEGNIEYWHCKDCDECFYDEEGMTGINQKDTVLQKLPPQIIKGMGQSIAAGEKKALSFTSNADFNDFLEVQIDGKTLEETNYTAVPGSIIVTLNADYAASLPVGEHTIGIVSESGTATAAFTVTEKAASEDSSGTGDSSNPALWAALILLSAAVITGLTVHNRRKRINE